MLRNRSFALAAADHRAPQHQPEKSTASLLAGVLFQGHNDISQQDGLLARYPGPALLVDGDLHIIAANLAGAALAEVLASGRIANLAHFVSACIHDNAARFEDALLPFGPGGEMLEASILPSGDGVTAVVLCRDVTLERSLRAALSDSRQRHKDLAEIAGGFAWETGPDGRFTFVSQRGVLGHSARAMIGRSPKELMIDGSRVHSLHELPFSPRQSVENAQFWAYRQDGEKVCLSVSATPLFDDVGAWCGARGICRDITDAVSRDAALANAQTRERLLRHILRILRDAVEPEEMMATAAMDTARALDADVCFVFGGQDAAHLTKIASFGDATCSADVSPLLAQMANSENPVSQDGWLLAPIYYRRAVNGVVALWRAGGEQAWSSEDHTMLANVADYFSIVVAQIASQAQIRAMTRTDDLTGVLNQQTFKTELARRWRRACYSARGVLIHCALGDATDETRRRLATVLSSMSRGHDLVARLGDDDFALWLEDAETSVCLKKAESVVTAFGVPYDSTDNSDVPHILAVGIAVPDGKTGREERLEAFLARAEAAMRSVKQTGKSGIVIADPPQAHLLQR